TAVSATLTGSNSTGYTGTGTSVSGSFSGIDTLAGGGSSSDTLTGENVASTWALGSTQTYADGTATLTFSAFESLQGGSAADTFNISANTTANLSGNGGNDNFNFSAGAGVSGVIDGKAGTNALNYAAYTTGIYVNLLTGTATGTGGILAIQNVTGGQG